MNKNYFNCECGEKVKITKLKLDAENGTVSRMSKEEIENFRHNKKCTDCVQKEDEEKKKEVKVWKVYDDVDDNEEGNTFFKNKDNALNFVMTTMKNILEDESNYDDDGNFIKKRIYFTLESHPLL